MRMAATRFFILMLLLASLASCKEVYVLSKLQQCSFADTKSDQDFLAKNPQQEFAIELNIPASNDAQTTFRAIFGDPYSATFWGRWAEGNSQGQFRYMPQRQAFETECDRTQTLMSVDSYEYDMAGSCVKFNYEISANQGSSQPFHRAHMGAVLAEDSNGRYSIQLGNFNLAGSRNVLGMRNIFNDDAINRLQCLVNNYNSSPLDIPTICGL